MYWRQLFFLLGVGVAAIGPTGVAAQENGYSTDLVRGWELEKSLKPGFKPYGLSIVTAGKGHPVRAGKTALRFEVRDGDCGWNAVGYSDCGRGKERHELLEKGPLTKHGDHFWYGWSMYLPHDYANIAPAKVALGQFHEEGDGVVWMLRNGKGGLHVNRQATLGRGYGFDQVAAPHELRGRWNDIMLNVHWRTDDAGRFQVFLNGRSVYDYRGPTLREGRKVYFKIGIYRFALERLRPTAGAPRVPTQVVYFDEIRRGPARSDVEISEAIR
jgi:hypothetical protein